MAKQMSTAKQNSMLKHNLHETKSSISNHQNNAAFLPNLGQKISRLEYEGLEGGQYQCPGTVNIYDSLQRI